MAASPRPAGRLLRAALALVLVGAGAAVLAGCLEVPSVFRCTSTDQCVRSGRQGTCEPSGFCSLPDGDCASGRRYVSAAGTSDGGLPLAGACVDPGACGGAGQACCAGDTCASGLLQCQAGTCARRPCAHAVGAGEGFSCAVRVDGTAWCWGDNAFGQLGDGTSGNRRETVAAVVGQGGSGRLAGLEHVVAGAEFACGHAEQSKLMYCWGRSDAGQLGVGTTMQSSRPLQVLGAQNGGPFEGVVGHSAGGHHVCVWDQARLALWCWGDNTYGQLGRGNTATMDPKLYAPGQVLAMAPSTPLVNVVVVGAGAYHTCAGRMDGSLLCWGRNDSGQLGAGRMSELESLPQPVLGNNGLDFGGATAIGAGEAHTCAVRGDGSVWCWGAGGDGQLGDGRAQPSPTPVSALGAGSALSVAAGAQHTCALKKDLKVYCWGGNGQGQLGLGGAPSAGANGATGPVRTQDGQDLDGVVDLALGARHGCAARSDGTVWCWGANESGQLGLPSATAYSTSAVRVPLVCE